LSYLELTVRASIALVFLVSSISKAANGFESFVDSVRDLGVLPRSWVRASAWLVLIGEFAAWIALAIPVPISAVVGFAIAAVLLGAFAVGIAAAVRRGAAVPCRCFGSSSSPLGRRHIIRNIVLASFSIAGAAGVTLTGPVSPTGALVAVAAGLLLGGFVVVLDDIVGLFLPIPTQQSSARGH
jgi:uncharacterized membrane protein YphA (DoxX/SURF4 family)